MFRKILAFLIIAGACNAYPHEDEGTPTPGSVNLENDLVDPETPLEPVNLGHVDPEREPVPEENEPVPTEVPNSDNPKSEESDLNTDATFWWPVYRSWWSYPTYRTYWSYPTYRSYWSYPSYSYYRTYYW